MTTTSSSSTTSGVYTDISSEGLDEIYTTTLLNLAIGSVLLAIFEVKRRKKSVYGMRLTRLPHRAPPPPPAGPFGWVRPVMRVKGRDFLRMAGLDAYMLVRFCRLCTRICTFGAFWGLLVLAPLYSSGEGGATDFYRITLANVASGSKILWAVVVFAYLFSWHALHLLRIEFRKFADLREDFLAYGDPDFLPQTRYSALVERVPAELRSNAALQAYFDRLFPGEVHSVTMCLDLTRLEALVAERERALERLEKARAIAVATGHHPEHREYANCCDCFGRPTGRDSIAMLAQELRDLNERVSEEQAACRDAANRLSEIDDEVLSSVARQLTTSLDQLAQRIGPAAWTARGGAGGGGGVAGSSRGTGGVGGGNGSGQSSPEVGRAAAERVGTAAAEDALHRRRPSWLRWGRRVVEGGDDESDFGGGSDATVGDAGARAGNGAATGTGVVRRKCSPPAGDDVGGSGGASAGTASPSGRSGSGAAGAGAGAVQQSRSMRDSLWGPGAKDALSALTFVGDSAINATRKLGSNVLYLTLGRRMSTTGFVTFTSLTAEAAATQVLLTHRPQVCEVQPAPEQRDIMWSNISIPKKQTELRHTVANIFFAFGAIFWAIPVAFVQAVTSMSELSKLIPFLSNLPTDSVWYSLLSGYLPVVALLGLINALPYVFQAAAESYEGCKSRSGVQLRVMTRYFYYQLANIYITVTAGSIFDALQEIVERPKDIFEILGRSFPSVAVYFVDLVIVKIFSGLTLELSRVWPLTRICWAQRCSNKELKTQRELRRGAFAEPELQYGWIYPTLLLVLIICLVYALISPFILPVGALYFALATLVYKHQALYVYLPQYESGGVFWYDVFNMALIGLVAAQITVIGYVALRGGIWQSPAMAPLPFIVAWFGYSSSSRYNAPSSRLSLERARQLDAEQVQLVRRRGGTGAGGAAAAAIPAEDEIVPEIKSAETAAAAAAGGETAVATAVLGAHAVEDVGAAFHFDLYAQPALTAPPAVPEPYREGWEDESEGEASLDSTEAGGPSGGGGGRGGRSAFEVSAGGGAAATGSHGDAGKGNGNLRAPLLKEDGRRIPSYGVKPSDRS